MYFKYIFIMQKKHRWKTQCDDNKIIAKCKVERTKMHNKLDILCNSTEEKSVLNYYFNIILHIVSY